MAQLQGLPSAPNSCLAPACSLHRDRAFHGQAPSECGGAFGISGTPGLSTMRLPTMRLPCSDICLSPAWSMKHMGLASLVLQMALALDRRTFTEASLVMAQIRGGLSLE